MNAKRAIYLFVFLALSSCALIGCGESSLSDVNLENPSLIRPEITVSKTISSSREISQTIEVWLYDKQGFSIELKAGSVRVNGVPMTVSRDLFGAPYYAIESNHPEVLPNTTYTFAITLADGSEYTASVTTQEKTPLAFNVPSRHNRGQDLMVSWQEVDDRYPMKIRLISHTKTDGLDEIDSQTIDIPNPGTGRHIIPASALSVSPDSYRIDLTLSSEKSGSIDSHFRKGGEMTSRFSIKKELIIE